MGTLITIYFVRHGKTAFNGKGMLQGWLDTHLLPVGRKNAGDIGKLLRKEFKKNKIKIDYFYSSDLLRTVQTAKIIKKVAGLRKQIIKTKDVREVNFGDLEGARLYTARKKYPLLKRSARFIHPGGESYLIFKRRIRKFILSLERKHKNKTILLVGHGDVIRVLLSWFTGVPLMGRKIITNRFVGKFVLDKGKPVSFTKLHK